VKKTEGPDGQARLNAPANAFGFAALALSLGVVLFQQRKR